MEKVKLDDFTKFKFLSGLKFSPSGEHACFVVHRMDVEENKYLSNLWLLDVKEKRYFQLTAFNEESSFVWLDDDNIIFSDYRNPKDKERIESGEEFTRFYKINIHGGKALEAFTLPKKVTDIKVVDSNVFLLTARFNLYEKDLEGLKEEEKKEELKKRKEKSYHILDEIPYWVDGKGFVNKDRNRLYIYYTDKNELIPLIDEYTNVSVFNLNKDSNKVVFVANTYKDKMELTNDVYIYDLKAKKIKKLNTDHQLSYTYATFLGDYVICLATDMKKYGVGENRKFYIFDVATGERKCITADLDLSIGKSVWTVRFFVWTDSRYGDGYTAKAEGDHLYFLSVQRYNTYLNRVDINGNIEEVITKDGSIDMFDVKDGNILFIGLRDLKIGELYEYNNGEERQITDFNEWLQKERKLSKPHRVEIETRPGHFIDGWIMKPVDYVEGKKYPAILDIHGGPKGVYGEIYFHEMQYWASRGYFVFFCNPKGSDGKGNEFADIRRKYGTVDYEDIMKFTDYVLENYPDIDSSKVGVTGLSYGGFMTNWIIGHTDRFKVAVSQSSISNWISAFGTTDIGYYFKPDQIGGTPWDNFEKYWEKSPLKYADRVKTPTLFIQSDEDYRCWMGEGIQMFHALKYFGIDSKLVLFHGESHLLSRSGRPKQRITNLKEITEWFDKYLK